MEKPSLRQRLQYAFDNFIARGSTSIYLILGILFFVLIVAFGLWRAVVAIQDGEVTDDQTTFFSQQFFIAFLELTDPGNMAQDLESSIYMKIPAVGAGVIGIVMLSVLIAIITTSLIEQMERLRKGRSRVIEEDHTLILGWDDQRVVEILRELIMANESEPDAAVVILSEKDKEEMDLYLRQVLPNRGTTRVITRNGSTSSVLNLNLASASTCKSCIILATAKEESSREEKNLSDARAIKTILALTSACPQEENELNVVVELFDDHHSAIIKENCPHRVEAVNANEILAKILVQTSRSVGLSIAYSEIFSFDGCEMYLHKGKWPETQFGVCQFHFPDGVPMGIRREDGELLINPHYHTALYPGDEVLILAQDDSTVEYKEEPVTIPRDLPFEYKEMERTVENELIIGWNRKGKVIIQEYAEYVMEGSRIEVILQNPTWDERAEIKELDERLEHLTIRIIEKDPLLIETLLAAHPSSHDNIIILSGGEDTDPEKADAQTILILLLLRKIFEENPDETVNTRLITEVMDSSNRDLIAQAGVKDFIISNRFVSMLLAQMSENIEIKSVYDSLFEEDGSEIYLKPAHLYFNEFAARLTFADCMFAAQKREEVCLGIKITQDEENPEKNFGVDLVPIKDTIYHLKEDDCLIVLAENEV